MPKDVRITDLGSGGGRQANEALGWDREKGIYTATYQEEKLQGPSILEFPSSFQGDCLWGGVSGINLQDTSRSYSPKLREICLCMHSWLKVAWGYGLVV